MLLSLRIHIFFNYLYFKSLSMYLIYLSIFSVIKIIIVNQDGPSKRPASINMNMLINSAEKKTSSLKYLRLSYVGFVI